MLVKNNRFRWMNTFFLTTQSGSSNLESSRKSGFLAEDHKGSLFGHWVELD